MKSNFARKLILLTIFQLKKSLFFLLLCSSCCKVSSHCVDPAPLYKVIPRHKSCIRNGDVEGWLLWALFGNDDDGIYGEGPHAHFRVCEPNTTQKFIAWWLRNPLHNFTFYVIGSADRRNSAFTLFKCSDRGFTLLSKEKRGTTEYPFDLGGIYLALHGGKPFISLRIPWSPTRGIAFYCGWRCRGNFGLAFNPAKQIRFADK